MVNFCLRAAPSYGAASPAPAGVANEKTEHCHSECNACPACPELVEGFEKKWGKFLANLKDDREAGDYEALSYLDEQTARRALAEAEEFVEKVVAFLRDQGLDVVDTKRPKAGEGG